MFFPVGSNVFFYGRIVPLKKFLTDLLPQHFGIDPFQQGLRYKLFAFLPVSRKPVDLLQLLSISSKT